MKVVQLSRADRVRGWNDRIGKGEEQGSEDGGVKGMEEGDWNEKEFMLKGHIREGEEILRKLERGVNGGR